MIEQPDLKPCPCCGDAAELIDNTPIDYDPYHILMYQIRCSNLVCGIHTDWHIEYLEAMKRWHKRPEDSSLSGLKDLPEGWEINTIDFKHFSGKIAVILNGPDRKFSQGNHKNISTAIKYAVMEAKEENLKDPKIKKDRSWKDKVV